MMKESLEKRQVMQKAVLEQYELAMKNDYSWNDLIESLFQLSSRVYPENYDLKELIHFYFSKSVLHSTGKEGNLSKVEILNQFLTDILEKDHQFPYEAISEIYCLITQFRNAVDSQHPIRHHEQFDKLLKALIKLNEDSLSFEKAATDLVKRYD